jgi:hypothetical protein
MSNLYTMTETSQNKSTNTDEIDLLDLFRRIGRTFNHWGKELGRAFLISVVFLLRRWLPLGLSLVAGVGLSYFMKYTSESFYTSDLILRNNIVSITDKNNPVSNADLISYINKLHNYCEEKNNQALAKALSFNTGTAQNILDINAFWIIAKGKEHVPDQVDYANDHYIVDTVNIRMQDRLDLRVKIKSPQELSLLQNAIISYINKDSLFQQRNRVRRRQNKELLTRLDYDILQLDTLQKVKIFEEPRSHKPSNGGQMIFLQEQKTQLVYPDIYNLYARKQALEAERDLYKDVVTVLSDFNLPSKRENGGLYYGKHYIPLIFVITLLFLVILANRNKLNEVYKKY